jgi:hypothetical protein
VSPRLPAPPHPPGVLRDAVVVAFGPERVRIQYALWQVDLPAEWVAAHPVAHALLSRRESKATALADPATAPLVRLLDAQGCFVPEPQATYTLREVEALFQPLRSQWYATYYAHPTWGRLRAGRASHNELLAWLLHNYHVARAAGIAAARMAALGRFPEAWGWRSFFAHDALEEYWHFDAYYSIDSPSLRVSMDEVKACVPLPSTLAFEQHVLEVAERSALGHVLVASFQESSIAFEDDSEGFYRAVESAYGLPEHFRRWKQHIRIDLDHGHAKGLRALLDSDAVVDAATVDTALRDAWLAFSFLCASLDEIHAQARPGRELRLRLPVRDGAFDAAATALVPEDVLLPTPPRRVLADAQGLYRWYTRARPRLPCDTEALLEADAVYLLQGVLRSSMRALGFARGHDEIMTCGRLCQLVSLDLQDVPEAAPRRPWSVAIASHLLEAAPCSVLWATLVDLLLFRIERLGSTRLRGPSDPFPAPPSNGERLRRALPLTPADADRWLTRLLQTDELLDRAASSSKRVPASLLLGG